ncbi:MAG TPA: shikimate kinase [Polyangiaceae bacterium]|jgi:XRE family aerobic/anaerobic benzoate catabolism transcriptional regulator
MNYSSDAPSRSDKRAELLRALGAAVRSRRTGLSLTLRVLAHRAGVSERFLAQLEQGEGNISVARLQDVAEALGTSAGELLSTRAAVEPSAGIVALLGLRGAGKSTLGPEVAHRFGVPFFELDALVSREAGMPLGTIFEMHGEAWFRRLELEVLRHFLDEHPAAVLATGGSLVTAPETYALLRKRATTVWLKARPQDHWDRVLRQGDARPMRNRANAMAELRTLLRTRRPLYALCDHVVDTSSASFEEAAARVVAAVRSSRSSKRSR